MTHSGRVMIMDDDVPLRTAFARVLERVGYSVVAMTGSIDVLELVRAHQPSLILLDNHMPGVTGIELIKIIRQEWSPTELPIVLISGTSLQGEVDEAMKSGATGFRRKPIDLDDLITTVGAALASSAPTQTAKEGSSS